MPLMREYNSSNAAVEPCMKEQQCFVAIIARAHIAS